MVWPSGEALACKVSHTGSIPVTTSGPIAQLGEHLFCTQGVRGSSPRRSTLALIAQWQCVPVVWGRFGFDSRSRLAVSGVRAGCLAQRRGERRLENREPGSIPGAWPKAWCSGDIFGLATPPPRCARLAESADALDSKFSALRGVRVQVSGRARSQPS